MPTYPDAGHVILCYCQLNFLNYLHYIVLFLLLCYVVYDHIDDEVKLNLKRISTLGDWQIIF